MNEYHEIHDLKSYVAFAIFAIVSSCIFPFATNPQFGEDPLTIQDRIDLAGTLLFYVATLMGALTLFWDKKVAENLSLANKIIKTKSRYIVKLESLNKKYDLTHQQKLAEAQDELANAHSVKKRVNEYPKLIRLSGYIAVCIVTLGTFLQVIGTGS